MPTLQTHFISELDTLLTHFDQEHEWSPAQEAEGQKHQRVAELRDTVQVDKNDTHIWQDF